MRRLLKLLVYLLVGMVALVGVAVGAVYWASGSQLSRTYAVTVKPVAVPTDAAALERGRHIAMTRGCADCHGHDFGGAKVIEDPAMGRLHGPNLTRGKGGVPASFSDDDWVRAIRHGVSVEGRGLVLMPSEEYSHFTDDDMGSLIAYLKSVPPVDRDRVPVSMGPVARVLLLSGAMPLAAQKIDHATVRPAVVTPGVTVEYGHYLAASCTGCHGANFSGGKIPAGPPDWPAASNLTPHAESRLTGWSEREFLQALRTGMRPDGTEISPVMPRAFGGMHDEELQALWLYLKTLPASPTGVR